MFTMPTAPRSIGGVLDDAFQLYRHSFWAVWPLAVISILLSLTAIGLASWRALTAGGDPQAALAAFTSVGFWLGFLLAILVGFWMYGAQILRVHAVAQGESLSYGVALSRGLSIMPAMLLATLVYGLVLTVAIILPAVAAAIVPGVLWRTLVALVLCVPFFVLYVTYYFYMPAIAIDDTGPFGALGRSRNLVRGNWWRVTAILTVGIIIIMVVYLTGGFIAGLLTTPIRDVLTNTVVSQILGGILSSAAMPLIPVLSLVIYYDLKLRKFGGDLAQRVDSLA
jgi:hypothetical protein